MAAARPARAPPRWLLFAVPAFLGAFAAAHLLTVRIGRELPADAEGIRQATERLQTQSAMRGHLHDMAFQLGSALAGGERPAPFDRPAFERAKAELERALEQHTERAEAPAALQPGDDAVARAVSDAVALFEQAAALAEQGDLRAARSLRHFSALREADAELGRRIAAERTLIRDSSVRMRRIVERLRVLSPLLDGLSAALGLALMIGGVILFRRLARMAEERQREAEARARELELFAGRVAHDLRNPLGAMGLRLLKARRRLGADERAAEELARLEHHVNRMNQLIQDLLEFARSGGKPRVGARADLRREVAALLLDLQGDAEQAGAELEQGPLPEVEIACPPALLATVLGNLLRNAIQYIVEVPLERRRIEVRASRRTGAVRIEVEDSGPGIARDLQRRIFEPFVRGASQTQSGMGMGLATVKRLVEAYHGRVGVESRPGEGSLFWVELPVAAAERQPRLEAEPQPQPAP